DQPVSQNICIGDEAILRVAATASGDINAVQYQWEFRATSQASWNEIGPIQTGAEFSEFAASEAGEYRARIEGPEGYSCDIGYSAIATVTINEKSENPTEATATNKEICTGDSTVLSLVGGGGGTDQEIKWYTDD